MMKKYEALQYFLKGNEHRPLLIKGTARVFRFKALRTGAGCIAPPQQSLEMLESGRISVSSDYWTF
jgi:hypothetical protein